MCQFDSHTRNHVWNLAHMSLNELVTLFVDLVAQGLLREEKNKHAKSLKLGINLCEENLVVTLCRFCTTLLHSTIGQ